MLGSIFNDDYLTQHLYELYRLTTFEKSNIATPNFKLFTNCSLRSFQKSKPS